MTIIKKTLSAKNPKEIFALFDNQFYFEILKCQIIPLKESSDSINLIIKKYSKTNPKKEHIQPIPISDIYDFQPRIINLVLMLKK